MFLVKTYAKGSLAVALLIAIGAAWGLKTHASGSTLGAIVMLVQTMWLLVSLTAMLEFPNHKAPVWLPGLFAAYAILYIVATMILGVTFPTVHTSSWLMHIKKTREPLHYAELLFAIVMAASNAWLLHRLQKQNSARPAEPNK
ncbi:MAG TPA: hypothetical protein V6D22_07410 [Candidatus Obscuribacterales bacterium]